ncbi:fungal hydrophobin, partial [Pilatotrama ljubarskyi]
IPAGECNTGSIQCCDQVQDAKSSQMSGILSSLGLDSSSITGLAGTSCSPIDVLALGGGTSCNQTPVCCNDNTYQGLINIGCVPIILQ